MSWKLSRTVLRRGKGSNPFSLVDYTSMEFGSYLKSKGIQHSFSRKGCPYDNAPIESFHSVLKKEEIHHVKYIDFHTAKLAIFEYIEGWYNRKRIHGSLKYKTPQQVEDEAKIAC